VIKVLLPMSDAKRKNTSLGELSSRRLKQRPEISGQIFNSETKYPIATSLRGSFTSMKSSREQKNAAFLDQRRNRGPKFLSLGMNLLTGIGFDLLRRYAKSWTASLKEEIRIRREDSEFRISGESKSETTIAPISTRQEKGRGKRQGSASYAARVFSLLKSTVQGWSQDKCPQLGAALAYYTVFSLAPLMLVLLAIFDLIDGGSEQSGKDSRTTALFHGSQRIEGDPGHSE
jgi:hypothetical protein